jgi:cysteine desulfuration protein SufE
MKIAEKKTKISIELAALKSGQDRLVFLVEKAKTRQPLPPDSRIDANRVPGCLAKLWLVAEKRTDRCVFDCDSDSLIVKAVAGLLCDFYSNQSPEEILAVEPDFLAPLGITQHLTPNRRNALARVREYIRNFAQTQTTPGAGESPAIPQTTAANAGLSAS